MQMCHREYNDRFLVQAVDQAIRKAGYQATTHTWFDLRAGQRKSQGAPDCPVYFIEKLRPQPCRLFIVPGDRVVKFLLGQGKKAYFHERRCLAITDS